MTDQQYIADGFYRDMSRGGAWRPRTDDTPAGETDRQYRERMSRTEAGRATLARSDAFDAAPSPEATRWAEQQAASGKFGADEVGIFARLRENITAQDHAAFAEGGTPGLLETFDEMVGELKPVPAPSRIAVTPPVAFGANPAPATPKPEAPPVPNAANVARLMGMVGLGPDGKPKPPGSATWGSYGLQVPPEATRPTGKTAAFSTRPDEPKPDPKNVARLIAMALADDE